MGLRDHIELDVIYSKDVLVMCEIMSAMSKADMYVFARKVAFYEQLYQCQVDRKLAISSLMDERARALAPRLGVEAYSSARDVMR
jgi:hypothetical protein